MMMVTTRRWSADVKPGLDIPSRDEEYRRDFVGPFTEMVAIHYIWSISARGRASADAGRRGRYRRDDGSFSRRCREMMIRISSGMQQRLGSPRHDSPGRNAAAHYYYITPRRVSALDSQFRSRHSMTEYCRIARKAILRASRIFSTLLHRRVIISLEIGAIESGR